MWSSQKSSTTAISSSFFAAGLRNLRLQLIEIGDERDFQIISDEDKNGQLLVSVRRIQYCEAWEGIVARKDDDESFEAEV